MGFGLQPNSLKAGWPDKDTLQGNLGWSATQLAASHATSDEGLFSSVHPPVGPCWPPERAQTLKAARRVDAGEFAWPSPAILLLVQIEPLGSGQRPTYLLLAAPLTRPFRYYARIGLLAWHSARIFQHRDRAVAHPSDLLTEPKRAIHPEAGLTPT